MMFDGYILRKVFEIFRQEQETNIQTRTKPYRNTVFSIKMRGFEIVKDPEAYSETCQTSKMKIFKKWLTFEKQLFLQKAPSQMFD